MYSKLIAMFSIFFLFSCNDGDKGKEAVNEQTENASGDIESQKKALNDQSKACIALMNKLEEEQNAAYASGDSDKALLLKTRIDSAAMENVRIGQKLMALDK